MRPEPPESAEFDATADAVRAVLARLLHAPLLARAAAESRAVAELVLAEVLNNVVEHAYGGQGGRIGLRLCGRGGMLVCRVVDRGRPMPRGRLPCGTLPMADPGCQLPQGGFGWPLIRALSQGLRYRRWRGCNVLVLSLPLDNPA